MPKYVIAKQLAGKRVITSDGEDVGRLLDVLVSEEDGKLKSLLVEVNPDSKIADKLQRDGSNAVVPYDAVMAVADYVIIDKKSL